MDGEKFSNVKVEELSIAGDVANEFIDTKEYAYHVDKNSFYALEIDEGKFEIAWGVSIDYGENRIYRLSYTVNDAVKTYNDCSEFYWMFLDKHHYRN